MRLSIILDESALVNAFSIAAYIAVPSFIPVEPNQTGLCNPEFFSKPILNMPRFSSSSHKCVLLLFQVTVLKAMDTEMITSPKPGK